MPMLAAAFAARLAPRGGRIVSTIDAGTQRAMEALVARRLAGQDAAEGVALLVVDAASHDVLAAVSGRGLALPGGFLDLTSARRSPGSALKPFIYGMAFDALRLHPQTLIEDAPGRIADYAPHNFDSAYHGEVTAAVALANSYNVPAVQVLAAVGPRHFVAALRAAGAVLDVPGNRPNLAVALGGEGISLRDLTMLYGALAGDGSVTALRERADAVQARAYPLLGPLGVYYVRQILQQSPPPPGMAFAVATGGRAVAFKTGTSYGFRDAWAVGYTPSRVIGVWLGRVDGSPRPGRFGRNSAAPLMLDAFGLMPPEAGDGEGPPPAGAILANETAALPILLRHFGAPAAEAEGPRILYPPSRSVIDLLTAGGGYAPITLHAGGGTAPLRWIVNGVPLVGAVDGSLSYVPDGPGWTRATVVDDDDRANSVVFRLTP